MRRGLERIGHANISLKHDLFGGEWRKWALGRMNKVRSILCHNYTTWQMSSYWEGCFRPIGKQGRGKKKSWLGDSGKRSSPRHPPSSLSPLLISPMSQQKALCTVSRGRLKGKGGTFACSFSSVYSLRCVCMRRPSIFSLSLSLLLSLPLSHKQEYKQSDCQGKAWSGSFAPRLRVLALACLLPFPFCSLRSFSSCAYVWKVSKGWSHSTASTAAQMKNGSVKKK